MKHDDIVLVKSEFDEPKKAKVNWVKDGKAGISYLDGGSNVLDVSTLTVLNESRGFKYNDIVKHHDGEARVNWVENGNVGITYLSPPEKKGAASVVTELELSLISASAKDELAERIASIDDKELEEHIMSIRRRRFPKPTTSYKRKSKEGVPREKKINFEDLFKKMEENPNK